MCLLTGIGVRICLFGVVLSLKVGRTNSIRRYWHEWCRTCVSTFVYHLQLVCRLFVLSIIYLFSVSLIFVCSLFASEFVFFLSDLLFFFLYFFTIYFFLLSFYFSSFLLFLFISSPLHPFLCKQLLWHNGISLFSLPWCRRDADGLTAPGAFIFVDEPLWSSFCTTLTAIHTVVDTSASLWQTNCFYIQIYYVSVSP